MLTFFKINSDDNFYESCQSCSVSFLYECRQFSSVSFSYERCQSCSVSFSIQPQPLTNQSLIELPSDLYSFFSLLGYKLSPPPLSKKTLKSSTAKKNSRYGFTVLYKSNILDRTKQIYIPSLSSYFRLSNNTFLFTSSNSFMIYNPIHNNIIGIFPIIEHNYSKKYSIFKGEGDEFFIETNNYRKRYKMSDLSKADVFYVEETLFNFQMVYGTNKIICRADNGVFLMEEKNGNYIPIKRISDDLSLGDKRLSLSKELFYSSGFDSTYVLINLMNETCVKLSNLPRILVQHNTKRIGRLIKDNLPIYKTFVNENEDIHHFGILALDDKMNLYCTENKNNLYIFTRNKILHTIPIDVHVNNVNLYGKRFVLVKGDNKALHIYDTLSHNWTNYSHKMIHKDIFYYKERMYYIQSTCSSISLIDIEDSTVLKTFNAEKYQSIAQVIVTPQNYLASFSEGSNAICLWDIELDEPKYTVSFSDNWELSVKGYEGLYIINNCLAIELKDESSMKKLAIYRLLPLDEKMHKGLHGAIEGYGYIKDYAKKEFYIYRAEPIIEKGKKRLVEIFHSKKTEDVLNNKYSIQDSGKYYQGILLLEDDITLLTLRKEFLVFNRKTQKILHRRQNMGVWIIHKTLGYYASREFTITGAIKVKSHTVVIREQDVRTNEFGNLYVYDAVNNYILYTIEPYGKNYYCDIFTRLSNGKIALRINTNYVEIWNFDIGQCEIKIQVNEVRYVKELKNKKLALIGDGGIQLINVKY